MQGVRQRHATTRTRSTHGCLRLSESQKRKWVSGIQLYSIQVSLIKNQTSPFAILNKQYYSPKEQEMFDVYMRLQLSQLRSLLRKQTRRASGLLKKRGSVSQTDFKEIENMKNALELWENSVQQLYVKTWGWPGPMQNAEFTNVPIYVVMPTRTRDRIEHAWGKCKDIFERTARRLGLR